MAALLKSLNKVDTKNIIASNLNDFSEVTRKLERCLAQPLEAQTEQEDFYRELANRKEETLWEAKSKAEDLSREIREIIQEISSIEINKLFGAEAKKVITSINLLNKLIEEKWDYLLPSTRKSVRDTIVGIFAKSERLQSKRGLWKSAVLIALQCLKSKENPMEKYIEAISSLINSILIAVLEDIEDEDDLQDFCTAKEKIAKGEAEIVPWRDYEKKFQSEISGSS